jgi:hypothetical protein
MHPSKAASTSASATADGNPIEVRSPGNVAELKLSLKTDVLEHYESNPASVRSITG